MNLLLKIISYCKEQEMSRRDNWDSVDSIDITVAMLISWPSPQVSSYIFLKEKELGCTLGTCTQGHHSGNLATKPNIIFSRLVKKAC